MLRLPLGRRSAGSFACLSIVERHNHLWARRVLRRPVVPDLQPNMSNVLSLKDQNTCCLTSWFSVHQLEHKRLTHAARTGACITWCTLQLPAANKRARQGRHAERQPAVLASEHFQTGCSTTIDRAQTFQTPTQVRTWMKRGNRRLQPRSGATWPTAARCTGEIVRSAPRISHTSVAGNHTSGVSPASTPMLSLRNQTG